MTVTHLTRGTGNSNGPTVSSGGGYRGSRLIVIENILILYGQLIDRRIRKVVLDEVVYRYNKSFIEHIIIICIINILYR